MELQDISGLVLYATAKLPLRKKHLGYAKATSMKFMTTLNLLHEKTELKTYSHTGAWLPENPAWKTNNNINLVASSDHKFLSVRDSHLNTAPYPGMKLNPNFHLCSTC